MQTTSGKFQMSRFWLDVKKKKRKNVSIKKNSQSIFPLPFPQNRWLLRARVNWPNSTQNLQIPRYSDTTGRVTGLYCNTNKNRARGRERINAGERERERARGREEFALPGNRSTPWCNSFWGSFSVCNISPPPFPPIAYSPSMHSRQLFSPVQMHTNDRRARLLTDERSRWSDFKPINGGFALNLQSALIRIIRCTTRPPNSARGGP